MRVVSVVSTLFCLALTGLFGLYVFHLSYQLPPPTDRTRELTAAPDFILRNQQGKNVGLGDFDGRKLVISFYRGHW